jgi:DNA-directed RNA polymerase subunit omega
MESLQDSVNAPGLSCRAQTPIDLFQSLQSLQSLLCFQFHRSQPEPITMTSHLVEEALKHVPNQQVLVNIVSKRVRQLNQGERPLVEVGLRTGLADTALLELIGQKLSLEYPADTTHLEE